MFLEMFGCFLDFESNKNKKMNPESFKNISDFIAVGMKMLNNLTMLNKY